MHIFFVVYVFCFGVYLFYSFFSYKLIVWIYNLYMLEFVLDFVKIRNISFLSWLFSYFLFSNSIQYYINIKIFPQFIFDEGYDINKT